MIKFVIVFDKPIRLGLHVFEVAGPFNTCDEASAWYTANILHVTCDCVIRSIFDATKEGERT